ncbi:tetratricopeptide repeat protein [Candidatus Poribacteria bacterium]|nr:tetratricopeptide repeat protein [Candidatus Poribacteria bacterium]
MENSIHSNTLRQCPRRIHVLFLLILVAAALLAYSNNFTAGFVYDDYPFILENPAVRTLSNPVRFFTSREAFSEKGQYVIYRPLATLSFALNYRLSGYNPALFHTVNILLHVAASATLYALLFLTFGEAVFAFFVALLFLLHPAQTEAVSWIAGRGNPMFLTVFFLAMICYEKWKRESSRAYYGLALLFAALSLLSKEMAVVLPVLLVVVELTLPRPDARPDRTKHLVAVIPFVALSIGYVVLRHLALGETRQMGYWGGGLWPTLLTMTKGFVYYVRLLFVPMPLMVEYVIPIARSPLQPTVLVSLLVLAFLVLACVMSYRRAPVVCFGIAWFFASLLPVSNVVPMEAVINERFLYLPSIGFCAILAAPLLAAKAASRKRAAVGVIIALALIGSCYGALTFNRNRDWRDSLSLWTASVKASPAGPTSQYNLGLELFKRGRYDEAIEHLKIACRLQESFPYAHAALGNAYFAKGSFEAAIEEYTIGVRQWPTDKNLRHNLAMAWLEKGKIHSSQGETGLAAQCFLNALKFEPGLEPAMQALRQLSGVDERG